MMQKGGERGYSWLFFYLKGSWFAGLLVTLLILGGGGAFYVWYSQTSNDLSPDSPAGYGYAIVGTIFLMLATLLYSIRRRSRKRAVGQLHAALNWHIFFAIIGLVLLFMHSFGNFNPRTGTYALCGMIALTVSGLVGRFLDRLMPRLITAEVRKALTAQGEDRIESISQKLQSIVVHNTQQLQGFSTEAHPNAATSLVPLQETKTYPLPFDTSNQAINTPWDLGYISLEATPQELSRDERHYRFVPDKQSQLANPGALMPGASEQIAALQDVRRALQREQMYRYIIRYWRVVHGFLALLTIGLTIWHLVYAAQLLVPTLLHP